MPVGFENSALKMSFSLSSLQPSSASLESPEHARLRSERQYNSLTKKPRRTHEQDLWRRSWGSRDDTRDEFWAALQPNYAYLMDNNLIDSCNEANTELSSLDPADDSYLAELNELNELKHQFTELYAWLNQVQDGVYGKEENVTDRGVRVSQMEELQRNSFRLESFNEKSSQLLVRSPQLGDEVSWRVSHLNSKWEMLEQVLTPVKSNPNQADAGTEVEHEVRCLRKWLSEMETRLQPLDFRTTDRWTSQELEEKAREHMVLQRDVEAHGKIVCSVVRLCERVARGNKQRCGGTGGGGGRRRDNTQDALGVARSLESRWHHLFLRSLEWSCMIEALADKLRNNSPSVASTDSDEGPANKYPRLSQGVVLSTPRGSDVALSTTPRGGGASSASEDDDADHVMVVTTDTTDADNMVGATASVRGGMKRRGGGGGGGGGRVSREEIRALEEGVASPRLLNGGAGKTPTTPATPTEVDACVISTTRRSGSNFDRENREAPNYATFYFKHLDTDSEQDARQKQLLVPGREASGGSLDESSEEEWTFTNGNADKPDTSGSSSETSTSLRRALHGKQRNSVSVRLDFGDAPMETNFDDEDATQQLVSGENNGNQKAAAAEESVATVEASSCKRVPWKSSRESIQRLVSRADEMVMSPSKLRATRNFEPLVFGDLKPACHEAKTARIKEWLDLHPSGVEHPADSCDASGEYTTGDSGDDKASETSEDQNISSATCRQVGLSRSGSSDAILEGEGDTTSPLRTPTHVVLRQKRRQSERPWSVSGIPQMLELSATGEPLAHFSISESALNHMGASPTQHGKSPNMGSGMMNMSSSTIDGPQVSVILGEAGSGSGTGGSTRRRKLRLKKRTMGRKSESGSDGLCTTTTGNSQSAGSSDNPQSPTKPITPSSYLAMMDASPRAARIALQLTGTSRRIASTSDSMLRDNNNHNNNSSSEEDDRVARRVLPTFKLGPEGGSVSCLEKKISGVLGGVGGGGGGVEEPHSSLSEQAWDNYQEKYMSEPYSEEPADSEAARRLLEFGDDYRNFLDSQSDCASSLGAHQAAGAGAASPGAPPRRRRAGADRLDSDSDLDDIRHVIQQSQAQLVFTEHVFGKQLANASPQLILAMDFAEIVATCRENVNCLRLILDNVEEDDAGLLSAHECKEIRGLVERWEMLQVSSEDLQRVRALQREMVSLKDELLHLASRVEGMEGNLQDRDQLECRINQVKVELSSLRDRKAKLLEVNVAVHRFLTDTGHPAAVLKDDVADLYRIWDETFQSVSQRLGNLQNVSTTWQQFDAHLSELQMALRGDQDTLRMLDTALQDGRVTSDVASSIMDVAKVLSEKQERYHEALCQSKPALLSDSATSPNTTLAGTPLSTEGSLSDSGISDEGSEQELSERERRLEALRRLARHLEGVLAPGSAVLLNMAKRIEQTENDLRTLQRTCRDLIVRTAICAEASALAPLVAPPLVPARTKTPPRSRKTSSSRRQTLRVATSCSPDDDDPDKHRSWLWRVMRSALPFQMALVALFCVACLLEPHCCDAMNTLNLSLTPQLRYLRGPPPV